VFIYKLLIPTLQITVLETKITEIAQNVALVLPHSALHVSLRIVARVQKSQALPFNTRPSSALCFTSATSLIVAAYTKLLR
jgi:hypothetical protein